MRSLFVALVVVALVTPADACCFRRRAHGGCGQAQARHEAPACGGSYTSFSYGETRHYAAPAAGCAGGQCAAPVYYQAAPAPQAVPQWAAPPAKALPQAPQARLAAPPLPTGIGEFLAHLNAYRARVGLRPVGYDVGLSAQAVANSNAQRSRGTLGHFYMGSARRQNAAVASSAGDALVRWQGSPPHNAALLDPGIRVVGLGGNGPFWTMNTR